MIRSGLRSLARRALGRPRSARSDSPRPAPPPPASSREEADAADLVEEELEVDADTLETWCQEGKQPVFLDIRELHEIRAGFIQGAVLLPMGRIPHEHDTLPAGRPLIVYCAAGARSFGVTHYLREQGLEDVWSLVGGGGAWAAGAPSRWRSLSSSAEHPLLSRVRLERDGDTLPGEIQDWSEEPDGSVLYTVRLDSGERVEGVSPGQLSPIGRRPS